MEVSFTFTGKKARELISKTSNAKASHILTTSSFDCTSGAELISLAYQQLYPGYNPSLSLNLMEEEEKDELQLKLLYKGKVIQADDSFAASVTKKKPMKIIVMVTEASAVREVQGKRSDPTIRGFDQEKEKEKGIKLGAKLRPWGAEMVQNKEFKFCRMEACTWQSFGHRATDSTPHAFKAMELLEKLASDPGVVAIMVERELVVGTLGEMDPIDDRLMNKTAHQGGLLLGYNTNMGQRIDLKLRTDDLKSFRPYADIVSTLIHELSHNWVGDHNALFWGNFAQMRVEYLHKHASLSASGYVVNGKTTAQIADVGNHCEDGMRSVEKFVIQECAKDMAQHRLPVSVVAPAIRSRCNELIVDSKSSQSGQKIGGNVEAVISEGATPRELALAAAERRARMSKENNGNI